MNTEDLRQTILKEIHRLTQVRPQGDNRFEVRMPFYDTMGDPVNVGLTTQGDNITVDDAGTIAGLLFSQGHHTDDSPGFSLMLDLAQAHRLELNFNEGVVSLQAPRSETYDTIAEMTKVIITMQTALPHLASTHS